MFDMLVERPDPSGRCHHQQRPMSPFQKLVLAWWSSRSPGAEPPSGSLSRELRKELGTVSWQRVTVISEMLQPMKKLKRLPILDSCYLPGAWSPSWWTVLTWCPPKGSCSAVCSTSVLISCHQIEGLSWLDFLDEDWFSVELMLTGNYKITISTLHPHLIPKKHR